MAYTFISGIRAAGVGRVVRKSELNILGENLDALRELLTTLEGLVLSNATITYAYDSTGNVVQMSCTNPAFTLTNTYNSSGWLTRQQIVFTSPLNATVTANYTYDSTGNLTEITRTLA
jgi:hypothetical protein